MDVSIVIPSAGKWSRLALTLKSLSALSTKNVEINLVLDGVCMPDDFERYLVEQQLNLNIIKNSTAKGRGASRNIGVKHATGEIVLFIDDDIVVSKNIVEAHLNVQKNTPSLCRGCIRELPPLVHVDEFKPLKLKKSLSAQAAKRVEKYIADIVTALDQPEECWTKYGQPSKTETAGAKAIRSGNINLSWLGFAGANLSAPRAWLLESPFDERSGIQWGLEDLGLALHWSLNGKQLTEAQQAKGLHLTHPRGQWKEDLNATRQCIDFLSLEASDKVVGYLQGCVTPEVLEEVLEPLFVNLT